MKGSCLCGEIEFELKTFNGNLYQCHCTLCRKQGGSSSNSGTVVPKDQLVWLTGQDKVRTWTKDTGFTACFVKTVVHRFRMCSEKWISIGFRSVLWRMGRIGLSRISIWIQKPPGRWWHPPERGLKRCLKLKTLSNYWGMIFILNRIGRLNQI